ncbi:MAG: sulfotransferase [Planctomycetaceae bacterium]
MGAAKKASKPKPNQGFILVWGGMTLWMFLRLLSMGPPISVRRTLRILPLPFLAAYNSCMALVEKLLFTRKIRNAEPAKGPLFIIGHWRSGTTLLHDLIAQDPQFAYPNLYQVMFPHHFLTTENLAVKLTSWMVPESRPMDNVTLRWSSTQEDEIALMLMTLLSPYLIMAFPDHPEMVEKTWDLNSVSPAELAKWKQAMQLFVKKMTVRDARQLVLKSPTHTMKIPHLLDLFPDARFLYIYRNPANVIRSGVHLRRTICETNSLGIPKLDTVLDDVLDTYERCFNRYHEDSQQIPKGQLHEVRFEDLEQDPVGELEKAYAGLSLGDFAPLKALLEPQVPKLLSYKKNSFDENPQETAAIYERLRFAFDQYQYPAPASPTENDPPANG